LDINGPNRGPFDALTTLGSWNLHAARKEIARAYLDRLPRSKLCSGIA
jgi:hypothetical protein